MIVVLTSFEDIKPFQPLTRDRPVSMLPVLNRPIIEHHIEIFVELGCRRFIVMGVDNPLALKGFLGDGSRWGCSIELVVLKEPCTSSQILERIDAKADSDLVIAVPSEIVLDVDYEALIRFQGSHQGFGTRVLSDRLLDLSGESRQAKPIFRTINLEEPVDTGVLVMRGQGGSAVGGFADYYCEGNYLGIRDSLSLWVANMAALGGQFSCLARGLKGGRQGDVWVGHHLHAAPNVTLDGPSLVGNYVRANSEAGILSWSVIGDGVIVDSRAQVSASVITDHTYIGTDTNVEHSIIAGKSIYNIGVGQWVQILDPFLVSDTGEDFIVPWAEILFQKVIALCFLLLTVPLWLSLGLIRMARGEGFFQSSRFLLTEASNPSRLTKDSHPEELLGFGNMGSLAGRLPGLLDVIMGRIRLVGVRPLAKKELPLYEEEWTLLREQAPCGLFTPIDAEGLNDSLEEEKIVAENYYSATRSFTSDVRIFFRGVLKLLVKI
jgi:acetyltransferase-like isoleucine patch superfamily enzyme